MNLKFNSMKFLNVKSKLTQLISYRSMNHRNDHKKQHTFLYILEIKHRWNSGIIEIHLQTKVSVRDRASIAHDWRTRSRVELQLTIFSHQPDFLSSYYRHRSDRITHNFTSWIGKRFFSIFPIFRFNEKIEI